MSDYVFFNPLNFKCSTLIGRSNCLLQLDYSDYKRKLNANLSSLNKVHSNVSRDPNIELYYTFIPYTYIRA